MSREHRLNNWKARIKTESGTLGRSAKRDDCLSAFYTCQECLDEVKREQSPPKPTRKKSESEGAGKGSHGDRGGGVLAEAPGGQGTSGRRGETNTPEKTIVVAITRAAAEVNGLHRWSQHAASR